MLLLERIWRYEVYAAEGASSEKEQSREKEAEYARGEGAAEKRDVAQKVRVRGCIVHGAEAPAR